MIKPKYKVTINWKGEIHQLYTHSSTELSALHNCIGQLAKKLDLTPSYVRNYVLEDRKDRYYVL